MKFCSMNGPTESEVERLLMSPCWSSTQNANQETYLFDGHKLLLDPELESFTGDANQKNSLDMLDNILLSSSPLSALSDLKPLPPFTGYTSHLSINGISGHHYHAIAQRLPEESNNNYMPSAYQTSTITPAAEILGATSIQLTTSPLSSTNDGNTSTSLTLANSSLGNNHSSSHNSTDQNIVSSSTCLSESALNRDADSCLNDVKLFSGNQLDNKLYSLANSCIMPANSLNDATGTTTTSFVCQGSDSGGVRIFTDAKDLTEFVDMNSIDDIAAIIGNAIADTTVPNQGDREGATDTRDSWMDLDAWIDGNCIQQDGKLILQQQDSLSEFILPQSPAHPSSSTLHSLLSQGYMPLLQNRLQNGPPISNIKKEAPSSTSFCSNELGTPTSSTASPPNLVVSTTDNILINPGYMNKPQQYRISVSSFKPDGICSPDLISNFPHTTTITPTATPKSKRSRYQKKSNNITTQHQTNQTQSDSHIVTSPHSVPQQFNSITSPSAANYNASDLSGLLGKEKPVHRCNICNRGFLNKSNIKVHLRTHTGEKPFRCEVCAKAFRQKAHLLKHQQIHKRIGRD